MKQKIFTIAALSLFLLSCEKVIDIDLNENQHSLVIEANIFNGENPCLVAISQTGNFFSTYTPQMVSKAKISLSNDFSTYTYSEIEEGIYRLDKIGKLMPSSYTLKVEHEGETYEAKSKMPASVPINYLVSEYETGGATGKSGYRISFGFRDPADEANYYRVKHYVNGELQNGPDDYYLLKDELFNGNSIQMELYGKRFEKDDKVTIELMSIDKNTYEYFRALADLVREETLRSAAPANPPGNFNNGALGYFAAWASQTRTIVAGVQNGN